MMSDHDQIPHIAARIRDGFRHYLLTEPAQSYMRRYVVERNGVTAALNVVPLMWKNFAVGAVAGIVDTYERLQGCTLTPDEVEELLQNLMDQSPVDWEV